MKLARAILVVLVLAAAAAANSHTVGAERTEPARYRWRSARIRLSVSSSLLRANANIKSGSDVLGALRSAAGAWADAADVQLEIQSSEKQTASPAGPAGDGISLVTIAATPENVLLFAREPQASAAKTRVFYNRRGMITEGDIVLNPFQQFSTDGSYGTYDLQAVFVHEIGHLLGLRHSDVLGSVMLASIPRNGAASEGVVARELSDADVSAIRDVYGTVDLMDDCCSVISGRLSAGSGRIGKDLGVWAEDTASGRVIGHTEVAADGTFRMGGISAGSYRIFVRSIDGASEEIGVVELEPVAERAINRSVTIAEAKVALDLVGVNGRLADTAIVVSKGDAHTLYVAGKGLDAHSVLLSVNSRFLHIDRASVVQKESADDTSVISFDLTIDPDAPRGVYSLFASSGSLSRSVLIGALRVQ